MPIPDFQSVMLLIMKIAQDGAEHTGRELRQVIDGRRLAELIIEHGIGVVEEHACSVKKIDSDYFDEA
jgi:restriction endonuclease Mrr